MASYSTMLLDAKATLARFREHFSELHENGTRSEVEAASTAIAGVRDFVSELERKCQDDNLDMESLSRLMRDPRYWRDRDPAIVQQVTEGFRRLYPDD